MGADDDYDIEWPDAVELLHKRNDIASGFVPIPDIEQTLLRNKGVLYIADQKLKEGGYNPEAFGIFLSHGDFYEIQEFHPGEIPYWTVELIKWEKAFDDLPMLTQLQYERLDRHRGLREL